MKPNSQQQKAICAPLGPVAIIAGPGTGKTKTLVERICYLQKNGAQPKSILALTFTKKAAEEMSERLKNRGANGLRVATFHSLCFDLLKEKQGAIPQFISEPERLVLLKNLPKPSALSGVSRRELSLLVSRAKNLAKESPEIRRLTDAYNAKLAEQNLCDFDDLLLQTHNLLKADAAWQNKIRQRFAHILVDEFQDTNLLQYQLLHLLNGSNSLFVIGDPQQSIYGFRGASGDIFGKFAQDFKQATQITLDINYRSCSNIVTIANSIYPQLPKLTAHNQEPGKAVITEVLNEFSEAAWVIKRIQQAIGGSDLLNAISDDSTSQHRSLRDFAVLYRSRSAARVLHKSFAESGIPMQIIGDGSPYDEPNVQTIVQLLAKIADESRQISINNMSHQQTFTFSKQFDPSTRPFNLAEQLISAFGFEPDDNLSQLLSVLVQFTSVKEATAYFDKIATNSFYDPRAEAVTLLTIHAAKGLEFPHVILIGAENGILPSKRGDIEEERRLFYVAVTRAKQQLDILHAQKRNGQPAELSSFAAAIDPYNLPHQIDASLTKDKLRAKKRQIKRAQTTLF